VKNKSPWTAFHGSLVFAWMGDKANLPIAVGGLDGIDKRVGSWGKKKKVSNRKRKKLIQRSG